MISFIEKHFPITQEEKQLIYRNTSLNVKVREDGGFLQLYSQRTLPPYLLEDNRIDLYKKFILSYEADAIIDGSYLHRAHFMEDQDVPIMYMEPPQKWLKHQIAIWSLDPYVIGILNKAGFTFEGLKENHGSRMIDIRKQTPFYDGFAVAPLNSSARNFSISDYVEYVHEPVDRGAARDHGKMSGDFVLFAVNVDMAGWSTELEQLRQIIPASLLFQSEFDALSYLRQEFYGVNVPQIYMKKRGVWTGGHQENLGVNAVNINHGPDDCIWISVDRQYVPKLRAKVKETLNIDILEKEGLWFKEPKYFLMNDIPVKYTLQKKGDVVILGAGCLHWVKALGQCINSAWNILCLDKDSLDTMRERYQINREINFRTVIPYKSLLLDIYIHERDLGESVQKQMQKDLLDFLQEEHQKAQSKNFRFTLNNKSREVQLCDKCEHEIFYLFYTVDEQRFYCIDCVPKPEKNTSIYCKYNFVVLYSLLMSRPTHCDISYCSIYKGQTKCKVQKKLKEVNEQSKYAQKRVSSMAYAAHENKSSEDLEPKMVKKRGRRPNREKSPTE